MMELSGLECCYLIRAMSDIFLHESEGIPINQNSSGVYGQPAYRFSSETWSFASDLALAIDRGDRSAGSSVRQITIPDMMMSVVGSGHTDLHDLNEGKGDSCHFVSLPQGKFYIITRPYAYLDDRVNYEIGVVELGNQDINARYPADVASGRCEALIHIAMRGASPLGVKYLLQRGADLDLPDAQGRLPTDPENLSLCSHPGVAKAHLDVVREYISERSASQSEPTPGRPARVRV